MRSALAICLALAAATAGPAAAQERDGEMREGLDLLGEGMRMILEGLREDLDPMLEELRPFVEREMAPFLSELAAMIDDLSAYELPERLPNGDIIIRRRPDADPPAPLDPEAPVVGEDGEVEL